MEVEINVILRRVVPKFIFFLILTKEEERKKEFEALFCY